MISFYGKKIKTKIQAEINSSTSIGLGQSEVSNCFLVEADVPAHLDVVLRLRLLQPLVVVGLQFNERPKNILVLVSVLVTNYAKFEFFFQNGRRSSVTEAAPAAAPRRRRASQGPGRWHPCSPSTAPPAC
jgi:hypothetical protein